MEQKRKFDKKYFTKNKKIVKKIKMSNSPKITDLQQNSEQDFQIKFQQDFQIKLSESDQKTEQNFSNKSKQIIYPINFCQTKNWVNFWTKVSKKSHKIIVFQKIQIYIYPWQLGQFCAYIPKLRLKNLEEWKNLLDFVANLDQKEDFTKTQELQKVENLVFLKIDFDILSLPVICPELKEEIVIWQSQNPELYQFPIDQKLNETNQKIVQSLQKSLLKSLPKNHQRFENSNVNQNSKLENNIQNCPEVLQNKFKKIQISAKKIQYLHSTTITLPVLTNLNEENSNSQKKIETSKTSNLEANFDTSEKEKIAEQTLDLEKKSNNPNYPGFQVLNNFYEKSQELWASFRPRVRRYSRKMLKELEQNKFEITMEKTQETWQDFYNLHIQTAQRQNFPTQNAQYLRELFWQEFTIIIIIKENGEVQSVFLGILQESDKNLKENLTNLNFTQTKSNSQNSLENENQKTNQKINQEHYKQNSKENSAQNAENTLAKNSSSQKILTYLLGGNSQSGLNNNVQYLLQLTALWFCVKEKCQFYDMGGWEFGSGYSEFKNGYRGNLQTFFGPFDLVLKEKRYNWTNFAINFFKKIRNLKKLQKFKKEIKMPKI